MGTFNTIFSREATGADNEVILQWMSIASQMEQYAFTNREDTTNLKVDRAEIISDSLNRSIATEAIIEEKLFARNIRQEDVKLLTSLALTNNVWQVFENSDEKVPVRITKNSFSIKKGNSQFDVSFNISNPLIKTPNI